MTFLDPSTMKLPLTLLTSAVLCGTSPAADWLQFRGPNASAVSTEAQAPGPKVAIDW